MTGQVEFAAVGGAVQWETLRSVSSGTASGAAIGIDVTGRGRRLAGRLRYLQTGLDPAPDLADRSLVEGDLLVGYAVTPRVSAWVGPRIRSFVVDAVTERWWAWSFGAAGDVPLWRPPSEAVTLGAVGELWAGLAGSTNLGSGYSGSRGLSAGLQVAVATAPVTLRLRYRVENFRGGDGLRNETLEAIALTVAYRR